MAKSATVTKPVNTNPALGWVTVKLVSPAAVAAKNDLAAANKLAKTAKEKIEAIFAANNPEVFARCPKDKQVVFSHIYDLGMKYGDIKEKVVAKVPAFSA